MPHAARWLDLAANDCQHSLHDSIHLHVDARLSLSLETLMAREQQHKCHDISTNVLFLFLSRPSAGREKAYSLEALSSRAPALA